MVRFPNEVSAAELAKHVEGQLLVGNPETQIVGSSPLSAFEQGTVTYCGAKNIEQVIDIAVQGGVGLALVPFELTEQVKHLSFRSFAIVAVRDSRLAFIETLQMFAPRSEDLSPAETEIHPTAVISPSAVIGKRVSIGPFCVVGNAEIGDGTRLHGFVSVRDRVKIGKNCVICEHTVLGKDGFGYQKNEDGHWIQFPHHGGVIIEDEVHIGASTAIDQGVMVPTKIGYGSRVDNLVHIAHNVQIGRHNMIIACAEISGSVTTGEQCWFGPNSSVLNGISIGDDVFIGIRALVVENAPDKSRVIPTRDILKPAKL